MALRLVKLNLSRMAGSRPRLLTRPFSSKPFDGSLKVPAHARHASGALSLDSVSSLPSFGDDIIDRYGPEHVMSKADFPRGWEYGHHPDDYQIHSAPIDPEFFINTNPNLEPEFRLFHRISVKISEGKYIPMSFVVHTAAPEWLYLSDKAYNVLQKHNRIETGYRMRLQNEVVFGLSDTPRNRQPFNIIGLQLIRRFGLHSGLESWKWENGVEYW